MKTKINIAEILRNKPHGIKLYSPIFGECTFCCVREDTNDICVKKHNGVKEFFDSKGLYYNTGEVMLFPSKEMRNWRKFSWKKGDVLVNKDGNAHIIFKKFTDNTYTIFTGNYYYYKNGTKGYTFFRECDNAITEEFTLETEDTVKTYISLIEERLDGKLNLKTLEIEKQSEFKDGDILVAEEDNYYDKVIFIAAIKDDIVSKVLINVRYEDYEVNYNEYRFGRNRNLRLATDSEKKQLFSALKKEGKAWDAEKKEVVEIKKEHQFKPFEKVLVRDSYEDKWRASFFSNIRESYAKYVTTGLVWKFCIPYEGNEHLLGTTNNVEK